MFVSMANNKIQEYDMDIWIYLSRIKMTSMNSNNNLIFQWSNYLIEYLIIPYNDSIKWNVEQK